MNPILLDTHAAVWSASGMLRGPAASAIDDAAERKELLLSPITAWEIGTLVRRGRISLAATLQEYVRALFSQPGVVTAIVTPSIAASAATLPKAMHADPADRLLVATAAAYGAVLMTRDAQILAFAKATRHLRCIQC